MANELIVTRIKVQSVNVRGESAGEPTYGVMASCDDFQCYNATFPDIEQLNAAISKAVDSGGSILSIADTEGELNFAVDHSIIGGDNYRGTDWSQDNDVCIRLITEPESYKVNLLNGDRLESPDENGDIRLLDPRDNVLETRSPGNPGYDEWLRHFESTQ